MNTQLIRLMAFSPDGKLLAIGWGSVVSLRDVENDGEPVRNLPVLHESGSNNAIYGIAFSPDGQLVAAGGMDRGAFTLLKVLRVRDGVLVHDLHRRTQHKRWCSPSRSIPRDTKS